MEERKIITIDYGDGMAAINAMDDLSELLEPYGLKLIPLEGGDGYDEYELIELK